MASDKAYSAEGRLDALISALGGARISGEPVQTISSTSATNAITGASLPVAAATYYLDAMVWCTNGATASNQLLGVNCTAAASPMVVEVDLRYRQLSANPLQIGETTLTAYGVAGVSGNGAVNIAATYGFVGRLRGFLTFGGAGTFTLCAACTTGADTFTVNAFMMHLGLY